MSIALLAVSGAAAPSAHTKTVPHPNFKKTRQEQKRTLILKCWIWLERLRLTTNFKKQKGLKFPQPWNPCRYCQGCQKPVADEVPGLSGYGRRGVSEQACQPPDQCCSCLGQLLSSQCVTLCVAAACAVTELFGCNALCELNVHKYYSKTTLEEDLGCGTTI